MTPNNQEMVPLRLVDRRNSDKVQDVHHRLAEIADATTGKHRDNVRWELTSLWRNYLKQGEFSVSTRLLDHNHKTHFRRMFIPILNDVAEITANYCTYAGKEKCYTRKFTLNGVSKKAPTYNGSPGWYVYSHDPSLAVSVTTPASWLSKRYESWCEFCVKRNLPQHLDLDGRTVWGRTNLDALNMVQLPKCLPSCVSDESVQRYLKLTQTGVLASVRLRHGRIYHPLSNLDKSIRRLMLLDGRPVAEVDIGACHPAILISELPNGPEKDKAVAEVTTNWYAQFKGTFDEWMWILQNEGKAYQLASGQWMIRCDNNPNHDEKTSEKVEFQRQCLFWRDNRPESNPLRIRVLQSRHPALFNLIQRYRLRNSATSLSHHLTQVEGEIMVQALLPELIRRGIPMLSNHDGCIVPFDCADEVRDILAAIAKQRLGFAPLIAIKGNDIPSVAKSELSSSQPHCETSVAT